MSELTAAAFTLTACQASAFTPELHGSLAVVLRDLVPSWMERFDGEPLIVPSADGGTRILLASGDGAWRAELQAGRVDLYWVRTTGAGPSLADFYRQAAERLRELASVTTTRVARLAAVVTRVAPCPAPGAALTRHFCDPRWEDALAGTERFELASHARVTLAGRFPSNAWTRSRTAASAGSAEMTRVHVEQDLNTLIEEAPTRRFHDDDLDAWFGQVPVELDAMLARFYPVTAP